MKMSRHPTMDKVVDAIVIFVAQFILDLWKFVNEAVDVSERYMFYINYAIFKPSRLIPQVPKKKMTRERTCLRRHVFSTVGAERKVIYSRVGVRNPVIASRDTGRLHPKHFQTIKELCSDYSGYLW